jgi:Barstar (barnase inhibitor)
MQIIDLDAGSWATIDDFLDAILAALKAPDWHGRNLNALLDSAIPGDINGVDPPYTVRIHGAAGLSEPVRDYVAAHARYVRERRADHFARTGEDFQILYEGDFGEPNPEGDSPRAPGPR